MGTLGFLIIVFSGDYIILEPGIIFSVGVLFITDLIFSSLFVSGRGFKRTAGILSIFVTLGLFGIGGIFILVGKQTEIEVESKAKETEDTNVN